MSKYIQPEDIPALQTRFCNSWTVTRADIGKPVLETRSIPVLCSLLKDKVIIETTYDYLIRINREIREGTIPDGFRTGKW